jgi:hypothetical protein
VGWACTVLLISSASAPISMIRGEAKVKITHFL